jgi:chitodextrinase
LAAHGQAAKPGLLEANESLSIKNGIGSVKLAGVEPKAGFQYHFGTPATAESFTAANADAGCRTDAAADFRNGATSAAGFAYQAGVDNSVQGRL